MKHRAFKLILLGIFTLFSLCPPSVKAGEIILPFMPTPGKLVNTSPGYTPAHVTGITIRPDNALQFDFLIHKGEGGLTEEQKKEEYTKLVKYFLASLTVPDKDQWVNLSPYEKNRIINDDFGKTEMGRDLLAQDYLLKQITSSLMYPESGLGKNFWDKVYELAHQKYGNTSIPVNTFNKVWIVPDEALIYQNGNTAYILKSHLKVMLQEDYLSLAIHADVGQEPVKNHAVTSNVVREVIIPQLEKEVNEGKNFAVLRQIVDSMILATWYKKTLKESLLGKIYADRGRTRGVDQPCQQAGTPCKDNEAIYQEYLTAFKKGVYNYIKEDYDRYSQQTIPRKYFAGGFEKNLDKVMRIYTPENVPDKVILADTERDFTNSVIDRAQIVLRQTGASSTVRAGTGTDAALLARPFRSRTEAYEDSPGNLLNMEAQISKEKGFSSRGESVAALITGMKNIYERVGLSIRYYHNQLHNMIVTQGALMINYPAGTIRNESDFLTAFLGAMAHDLDIRIPKLSADEPASAAFVHETLGRPGTDEGGQLLDLLRIRPYVRTATSFARFIPATIKRDQLTNEEFAALQDLLEPVGTNELRLRPGYNTIKDLSKLNGALNGRFTGKELRRITNFLKQSMALITEEEKEALRRIFDKLLEGHDRKKIAARIITVIRRTDFSSDVTSAGPIFKNATDKVRRFILDKIVEEWTKKGEKMTDDNLRSLITAIKSEYEAIKARDVPQNASPEQLQTINTWLDRQMEIEVNFLESLKDPDLPVGLDDRYQTYLIANGTEVADQTVAKWIFENEPGEETVLELHEEKREVNLVGNYTFFDKTQILPQPVVAWLKYLPINFKKQLIDQLDTDAKRDTANAQNHLLEAAEYDWTATEKDNMLMGLGVYEDVNGNLQPQQADNTFISALRISPLSRANNRTVFNVNQLHALVDNGGLRRWKPQDSRIIDNIEDPIKFEEPNRNDYTYIVVQGAVEVILNQGQERKKLGPGAMLGELGLLNGYRTAPAVTAEEDTVLARMNSSTFMALLLSRPAFRDMIYSRIPGMVNTSEAAQRPWMKPNIAVSLTRDREKQWRVSPAADEGSRYVQILSSLLSEAGEVHPDNIANIKMVAVIEPVRNQTPQLRIYRDPIDQKDVLAVSTEFLAKANRAEIQKALNGAIAVQDRAMRAAKAKSANPTGGIDLNAANLNMKVQADGTLVVPGLPANAAQIIAVEGFSPVIQEITPMTYLPPELSGLNRP